MSNKRGNNVRGPQGHTQNGEVGEGRDWNRGGRRPREEGTGRRTSVVQPYELTFGGVGMKAKAGTLQLNYVPSLLKKIGGAYNNSIVQIPKIQAWIESPNLIIGAKTRLKRRGPNGSPC